MFIIAKNEGKFHSPNKIYIFIHNSWYTAVKLTADTCININNSQKHNAFLIFYLWFELLYDVKVFPTHYYNKYSFIPGSQNELLNLKIGFCSALLLCFPLTALLCFQLLFKNITFLNSIY